MKVIMLSKGSPHLVGDGGAGLPLPHHANVFLSMVMLKLRCGVWETLGDRTHCSSSSVSEISLELKDKVKIS